jgi:hypothetical protein
VKVGSPAFPAFLNQIREKREPDADDGGNSQRDHGGGGQQEGETPAEETVDAALQGFAKDPQAQASGLQAERTGQGPGLKIVLKNATGGVVRQLSGEEFVKLREATAKGGPRGKILDRKL